jgi:hypothetical protein
MKRGAVKAVEAIAARLGVSRTTALRKYYDLKKKGVSGLVDNRRLGPDAWNMTTGSVLPESDIELLRLYIEKNQRSSEAGIRAMKQNWREGKITTTQPINLATGYPQGWSDGNLKRYAPSKFELKASRIGRTAAASERRLVYTTRKDLYVGQFYLFDDMWHDHFVNNLDLQKTGRPLEFHALDLASACKFAWGMRVRTENADGSMESLKEADMRFLLAAVLAGYGYHPQGTTLVVEHGTAAIKDWLESFLYDVTGGLIKVARSGMDGAAAHAGQYAGRSKGNFRFKAALESLGNLIHNEMAALPAQTGKDRDHRPEQLHGLLKHNDALLMAISQLPAERIDMLQWPMLTVQQFRVIAAEIYMRINSRTEHNLEGWDMNYRPDTRLGGMRKLSPLEVWQPGRRALIQLPIEHAARIIGTESGKERLTRSGMFSFTDSELSGDELRFDAHALADREKYLVVVNPFWPEAAFAFDSKDRFVSVCARIHSVSRADQEAINRECGAAAKLDAIRLTPLRARHMAEAREKAAMHRNNANVLSGAPVTPEEKIRNRTELNLSAKADAALAAQNANQTESDSTDDDSY